MEIGAIGGAIANFVVWISLFSSERQKDFRF